MSSKLKIVILFLVTFLIGGITISAILIKTSKDDSNNEAEIKYMATVVVDGYELKIPDQYRATILEDVGLLYWDKGHFYMYIFMGDGNYDELKDSLEEYTDDDYQKNNLDVIIPYREIAIDGRAYIYMVFESDGETMINCYHPLNEGVICQVMIGCYDISYNDEDGDMEKFKLDIEKMILLSDKIVSTAKPTKEEDTPPGEVYLGQDVYKEWLEEQRIDIEK